VGQLLVHDLNQFAHLEEVGALQGLDVFLEELLLVDAGLAQTLRVDLLLPAVERVLLLELEAHLVVDVGDGGLDVLVLLTFACQLPCDAEQVGLEELEHQVFESLLEDAFDDHKVCHQNAFVSVGDQDALEHVREVQLLQRLNCLGHERQLENYDAELELHVVAEAVGHVLVVLHKHLDEGDELHLALVHVQ